MRGCILRTLRTHEFAFSRKLQHRECVVVFLRYNVKVWCGYIFGNSVNRPMRCAICLNKGQILQGSMRREKCCCLTYEGRRGKAGRFGLWQLSVRRWLIQSRKCAAEAPLIDFGAAALRLDHLRASDCLPLVTVVWYIIDGRLIQLDLWKPVQVTSQFSICPQIPGYPSALVW